MNTLKISCLFLFTIILMTSCEDKVDPAETYIGHWALVDASGDGNVAIEELGSEFDTKIIYESSDAFMNINEDNTLETGGQIMVTMELYLSGILVSSELMELEDIDATNVWNLDSDDNFQSPEFDETDAIEFDGNTMTLTTTESIDMDGIAVYQEIEFFFEKSL